MVLVAVAGALCNAGYSLATRGVAGRDAGQTTLMWTQVAGDRRADAAAAVVLDGARRARGWAVMAGIGAFGAVGHALLIKAHQLAPASALAPFGYSQLLWMIVSGYFVFGDWPPATTLIGAGLVVGCGLFLLLYERARRRITENIVDRICRL